MAQALPGCGDDTTDMGTPVGDGGCEVIVEGDLDCTPAFDPPDFTAIYDNVLKTSCGNPGTDMSCHGPDGAQAGLVLWEPEVAYAHLLEPGDSFPRVVPGKPECSGLMWRLQSEDPRVRMPLNGAPLSDPVICAVRLWIAEGADGP